MKIHELLSTNYLTEAPVNSSWVVDLAYAYPWNLKTVIMVTNAGVKYRILNVPQSVLAAWRKSNSKGQFFHQNIKNKYRVVK
jgi:hypothetical protein